LVNLNLAWTSFNKSQTTMVSSSTNMKKIRIPLISYKKSCK